MGRPRMEDPLQFCKACGAQMHRQRFPNGALEDLTQFRKRVFCNQACMAAWMMKPVELLTVETSRIRARKNRKPACETCGRTRRLVVHHMDENPFNNELSNLKTLCITCHNRWHWEHGKQNSRRAAPCLVCSKPSRRHRYCEKHAERFRKYGDPLLTKRGNSLGSFFVREVSDGISLRSSFLPKSNPVE